MAQSKVAHESKERSWKLARHENHHQLNWSFNQFSPTLIFTSPWRSDSSVRILSSVSFSFFPSVYLATYKVFKCSKVKALISSTNFHLFLCIHSISNRVLMQTDTNVRAIISSRRDNRLVEEIQKTLEQLSTSRQQVYNESQDPLIQVYSIRQGSDIYSCAVHVQMKPGVKSTEQEAIPIPCPHFAHPAVREGNQSCMYFQPHTKHP